MNDIPISAASPPKTWPQFLRAQLRVRNAVLILLAVFAFFAWKHMSQPSFEETVAEIERLGGTVSRDGMVKKFDFLPKPVADALGDALMQPSVKVSLNNRGSTENHVAILKLMGQLPNVSELYLYSPVIRDEDLAALRHSRGLVSVNLSCPHLKGSCLRDLRRHSKLSKLSLRSESLDDSVTRWASSIPQSIVRVELTGPGVTDETVQQLAGLKNLRELRLIRGRVTGSTLSKLTTKTLWELDLNGNPVNDAAMNSIAKLGSLRFLGLNNTNVTDVGVRKLSFLPMLSSLSLANTSVTGTGFGQPGGFQQLETLVLEGSQVTDEALPHLLKSPTLDNLDLSETSITGAGFEGLACHPLNSLNLAKTRLTDQGLLQLKGLTLMQLRISSTGVSDEGVSFLKEVGGMRTVALDGTRITPAGIKRLRSSIPHLIILGATGE